MRQQRLWGSKFFPTLASILHLDMRLVWKTEQTAKLAHRLFSHRDIMILLVNVQIFLGHEPFSTDITKVFVVFEVRGRVVPL